MNRILGMMVSAVVISTVAAGCQTTQTEQLTVAERREAAIETVMANEEQQQVAVSDEDYDPNEMICKTIKKTNSRLARGKDCRTAKEWRDSMTAASRSMNDFKDGKGGLGAKAQ